MHLLSKLLLLGQALPSRKLRAGLFLKCPGWLTHPLELSEPNPTEFPRKISILLAQGCLPEAHIHTYAETQRYPHNRPLAARSLLACYCDNRFSWIILFNPRNSWEG